MMSIAEIDEVPDNLIGLRTILLETVEWIISQEEPTSDQMCHIAFLLGCSMAKLSKLIDDDDL